MTENDNKKKRKKKSRHTDVKSSTKKKSDISNKKQKMTGSDVKKKHTKNRLKQKIGKKNLTIISSVFDFVFFFIILFMLASASLFMISKKEDKTFLGYRFYDVLTNSMVKTHSDQKGNFKAGDMIIVKSIDPNDVEVDDIVTFVPNKEAEDTYLTHRVIEKRPTEEQEKNEKKYPSFVTQGDANNSPDPQIDGENIIGKVTFTIPNAGKLIKIIRTNGLLSIVFVSALFMLLYILKGYFTTVSSETKNRRKKNAKIKKK